MVELTTKRCDAWFDRNRCLAVSRDLECSRICLQDGVHGEASYTKGNGFWYMYSRRGEHVMLSCDIFSRFNNVEMRSM